MKKILFLFFLSVMMSSCGILNKNAKEGLSDGIYKSKSKIESKVVYVDVEDEAIHVYPVFNINNRFILDSVQSKRTFLLEHNNFTEEVFTLKQNNFDIDFLTIPFKLRFAEKELPAQLKTELSGAIYFGYRTDIFKINYTENPLGKKQRETNHFAYSFGFFTGFGNTEISPTTTNKLVENEYEGVVWNKGIAVTVGVNRFTVGLAFGLDNLLDGNKNYWIYENRPWIGLSFGLNLN